jgi:hypothetical protein
MARLHVSGRYPLKILKITGLTQVFGIYQTVDQAIAATKGRR